MKFFYFLILLFFQSFLTAQVPEWVVPIREIDKESISDMVTGSDGSIYAVGLFEGHVDFDPGPGLYYMNTFTQDKGRIFCIKLSPNGNLIWAKQMGGNIMASITDDEKLHPKIAIDGADNIYITGMCFTNVDLDPSPFSSYFIPGAPISSVFRFVGKYKLSDGGFQWVRSFASNDFAFGYAVDVDETGNVYSAGTFKGTVDFNPDPNTTFNMTSIGPSSIYFLKLNSTGQFVWAKNFGAIGTLGFTSSELPHSVAVKGDKVYLAGHFLTSMDCNPDDNAENWIYANGGNDDIFFIALNAGGNFLWAKSYGGELYDYPYNIHIDANNDILLCGRYSNKVNFYPGVTFAPVLGVYDGFLLKLKENAYLNLKTDESDFRRSLKVYPNPTSDIITVVSDSKISVVTVNNAEGKLILSKKVEAVSVTLSIKDLPAGVYFVNTVTGSKNTTQKIIKK